MTLEVARELDTLTTREREVIAALMLGVSTKAALASTLMVSEHTVHYHLANIMRKLECNDRVQVVNYAWQNGRINDSGAWEPAA